MHIVWPTTVFSTFLLLNFANGVIKLITYETKQ